MRSHGWGDTRATICPARANHDARYPTLKPERDAQLLYMENTA